MSTYLLGLRVVTTNYGIGTVIGCSDRARLLVAVERHGRPYTVKVWPGEVTVLGRS